MEGEGGRVWRGARMKEWSRPRSEGSATWQVSYRATPPGRGNIAGTIFPSGF